MFGFIYIAAPQLLFDRLPWLLGYDCPSTGAGLLRWVARAVIMIGQCLSELTPVEMC